MGPIERFWGKVAVVTGAARGIGLATAAALSDEGADVWLLDRRAQDLRRAEDRLGLAGAGRALVVDHTRREDVDAAVETVLRQSGALDIAVANAGWAVFRPFLEIDPAHWGDVIGANLTGTFHIAQACARAMKDGNHGRAIVLVASIAGLSPTRDFAHYAAAKAGVIALGKTMALELGPHGIRTNIVCPGYIHTPATDAMPDRQAIDDLVARGVPLGRWGRPEEVATAILHLASRESSFTNGSVVTVAGGTVSLDLRSGPDR